MNAPSTMNEAQLGNIERAPFAAFVCDEDIAQAYRDIAIENGWDAEKVSVGGIAQAIRSLALEPSPSILVVDVSEAEDPRGDIAALSEVCLSGTLVISMGTINDVSLYRDLASAGVYDYLVKPIAPQVLREAIISAEEALTAASEATQQGEQGEAKQIIAVVGARGGVGTTTVAVNVAWVLANTFKHKVALVDLDLSFGTTALSFDLEPGRGLCDALDHPDRVDGLFIERAMVKESENLSILGAEAPLSDPTFPDRTAVDHLIEELSSNFDYLVVDLPQRFINTYRPVLERASKITVVSDLSLPSIRDTIRLLGYLGETAHETPICLVANKFAPQGEISKRNFEEAIERKVDAIIPLDTRAAVASSKSAKSIVQAAGSSKAGVALKKLADEFAAKKVDDKPKGSFFDKLLKGKSGKEG